MKEKNMIHYIITNKMYNLIAFKITKYGKWLE